jgi:hypothetical protein
MKRFLHALRLWAWFAIREHTRYEPFSWFLQHYDRRQATFQDETYMSKEEQ